MKRERTMRVNVLMFHPTNFLPSPNPWNEEPIMGRSLFANNARWLLLLVMLGLLAQTSSSQEGRKLGTCGPPPRKNPQRQTSAESMPPLPLPATPLRRSEPKAEPAPP